jgi:hypothetical protein
MKYIFLTLTIFFLSCSGDEEKKSNDEILTEEEKNVSIDENKTENLIGDENKTVDDEVVDDDDEETIVIIPDEEDDPTTEDIITSVKEKMVKGREYRVYQGDKVVEISNAVVRITKRTDREYSSVFLVSGSATVYRSAE